MDELTSESPTQTQPEIAQSRFPPGYDDFLAHELLAAPANMLTIGFGLHGSRINYQIGKQDCGGYDDVED